MKKIKNYLILLIMSLEFLTGCGSQGEDVVDICRGTYARLVDEHNVVVALYANSPTEEYGEQLDDLSERVQEIGMLDVEKMDKRELETLASEMKTLMGKYEEIYHHISEALVEETKYCQVSVTLKNMTTLPFYEIYFYNSAEEETRTNLLTDCSDEYDGLEALNLVNLEMDKDQTVWHLETMDAKENVIESADVDLAPYQGGNVTIEMYFSFDTNEGWLEIK